MKTNIVIDILPQIPYAISQSNCRNVLNVISQERSE